MSFNENNDESVERPDPVCKPNIQCDAIEIPVGLQNGIIPDMRR